MTKEQCNKKYKIKFRTDDRPVASNKYNKTNYQSTTDSSHYGTIVNCHHRKIAN